MPENTLQDQRIAILVTDGFEQSELVEPRKALDQAGAKTVLVAPAHKKTVQGMNHGDKADQFQVDQTLDEARPEEFDAVLLPGGVHNADHLRVEKKAQEFVRKMDRDGKPIAVICHGPWLLVSAGLTRGRTLTSYHTIQDDIRNSGGKWEDRETVRDRNWISSRQPADIPAFNREMLALFSERKARRKSASLAS
jgi:protease I